MTTKIPLVNSEYLLKKFAGRGGWTYALLPEILPEKRFPFGWMRVSGKIDEYKLDQVKLMPFGDGTLFLPVKSAIRKEIKKEEGDRVRIILYKEDDSNALPEEILDCLKDCPTSYKRFLELPGWEQKLFMDSIREAQNPDKKVDRIVKMIEKLNY
jgi:hypothetical protein